METQIKKPPHNLKEANPDIKVLALIFLNTVAVNDKNNASRKEDVILQRYAAINLILYFYPKMSSREVSEYISEMSQKEGNRYSHSTIIHAKHYHKEAMEIKGSNRKYVEFYNTAKQNVLNELLQN
jgi:hypothetical protein